MAQKKRHLGKKGIAMGVLIVIVLSGIFLVLVLGGPLKTATQQVYEKIFGNEVFVGSDTEDSFSIYTGPVLSDEKKAEHCANKMVARGNKDFKNLEEDYVTVCPKGFSKKEDCEGVAYGSFCVFCTEISPRRPSLKKANALAQIGINMKLCYGQYAEATVRGPCHAFSTVDLEQGYSITQSKINNWLYENGGETGKELSGKGILNMQDWRWLIGPRGFANKITKNSPRDFFMYSDGSGLVILNELEDVAKEDEKIFTELAEKYGSELNIKIFACNFYNISETP